MRAGRVVVGVCLLLACRASARYHTLRGGGANSHYSTLGVGKSASADEIKSAYRKLALKHHPDRGGSEKDFKAVNEAFSVLSDPSRRRQYDMQQTFGGGGPSAGGGGSQEYYYSGGSMGASPFGPRGFAFGQPGFGGFEQNPFGFPQQQRPPAVPPPRANRPFYCTLSELHDGTSREFTLHDNPFSRLRDACYDRFSSPAEKEALWKTVSLASAFMWRFPGLCFGRRGGFLKWWIRLPTLAIAFLAALSQQLPHSPHGTFKVDVKSGWRHGTRVVFDRDESHRAVAFELRERRHPNLVRSTPASTGDLLWRTRVPYTRAKRGTTLKVTDVTGKVHKVELRLTDAEVEDAMTTVRRKVGTGRGMPRKAKKGAGGGAKEESSSTPRGDLYAEVTLVGAPGIVVRE